MDGRAFLQSARHLLATPSEANWRSAAGRAYYALLHEGRVVLARWGFPLPPRDSIHTFVRLRFTYPANADVQKVGDAFDLLSRLRTAADYRLASPGPFADAVDADDAVQRAQAAIDLLDQIEADPARRAAAVAAVRKAFP
jgi:hypothetical protein